MRLTPRQLPTTPPHPPVTMVRCMGPYNPLYVLYRNKVTLFSGRVAVGASASGITVQP